jgi:hypothetical protein
MIRSATLRHMLFLAALVLVGYGAPVAFTPWRAEAWALSAAGILGAMSLLALLALVVKAQTLRDASAGVLALVLWLGLFLSSWARCWGT